MSNICQWFSYLIEQNAGPTIWFCSVCHMKLFYNINTVKCTGCNNWCHLRKCSAPYTHCDWSPNFIVKCCIISSGIHHIPHLQSPRYPIITTYWGTTTRDLKRKIPQLPALYVDGTYDRTSSRSSAIRAEVGR